jgi:hypothetical protein
MGEWLVPNAIAPTEPNSTLDIPIVVRVYSTLLGAMQFAHLIPTPAVWASTVTLLTPLRCRAGPLACRRLTIV